MKDLRMSSGHGDMWIGVPVRCYTECNNFQMCTKSNNDAKGLSQELFMFPDYVVIHGIKYNASGVLVYAFFPTLQIKPDGTLGFECIVVNSLSFGSSRPNYIEHTHLMETFCSIMQHICYAIYGICPFQMNLSHMTNCGRIGSLTTLD